MAETLLLLVFCLLIAAASIFSHKLMQVKALQAENEELAASLRDSRNTVELMQSKLPDGAITDDWKRIVRDYGPAIHQMEEAGVPIKDVGDAADVVVVAVKAHQNGATADEMTQSIALQQSIKQEFSASAEGVPSNEQITSLIREGRQVQTATTKDGGKGKHDWPPIITLSEADGHYFDTGSAVLKPDFRKDLSGPIIEKLLAIIQDYPDVNVIEVIGHTDEQPILRASSNLDKTLNAVLQNNASVDRLTPADNAGLGLARAASVSQVLLKDKRLNPRFAILPYSGAQLVNVNDSLVLSGIGGDVKERRRIEIRLRKSDRVGLQIAKPAAQPTSLTLKPAPASLPAPRSPGQGEVDTAIAQPQPALPEATVPDADIQVVPDTPPRQTAPSPGQFRPLRWMFGN
ncbi:hypothetical protein [Methyloceanibacter sp.]|uniref:hypothetical protein n=1 Tax=Methyloceanibacter sp. TaxID=1965321 RepID=UPI002BA26780|nr:hypothetical protein [Methyloceanibacter sp.]HML92949.1 OmpA family protein [Methyloceanibacter sp.]